MGDIRIILSRIPIAYNAFLGVVERNTIESFLERVYVYIFINLFSWFRATV